MAKTETTVRGYVYTVTSPNGGTVTDAEGKLNKTVDAGDQVTVTAPSDSLTCDDDDAVICKANFKSPLLALRLLGQGGNALPAGYTRLDFLKSTGTQYIDTEAYNVDAYKIDCRCQGSSYYTMVLGYARSDSKRMFGLTGRNIIMLCVENSSFIRSTGHEARERHVIEYSVGMNLSCLIDGVQTSMPDSVAANDKYTFAGDLSMYMFAKNIGSGTVSGQANATVYSCSLTDNNGVRVRDFIPALDKSGEPCMFDRVSKQAFRNAGAGQFVAGVGTVAQLSSLLRNLPATGGSLTLSLPAEANTPEVAEALQACHDTKGWTITVHEYRPAAAATYSLRRVRSIVWCRRELSEYGSYVDADGFRWQIDRCAAIFGRLGQDPAAYGYTPFDSVEQAAEEWGLSPYVDPNAEELSTEFEK